MTKKKQVMPRSKNTTIILLSLLAIGLAAFSLNYYKNRDIPPEQKVAETKDLVVYTNSKYGYTIKYPSNYTKSGPDNYLTFMSPREFTYEKTYTTDKELEIEFVVENSETGDTLEKFLNKTIQNASLPLLSKEIVTVAGRKMYHLVYEFSESYLVLHKQFRISIFKYPGTTSRQSEFNTIIKNLEFSNPSTSVTN